jgi:hypothetical protein
MPQQDEGSLRSQASGGGVESEHAQAVEDWTRNDEQMLAENQRLADELERVQDELVTLNRLYRRVGAERDEKQFEIERLRRWVDRFRAGLAETREQVERTRRAERRSIASVLTGMLDELEAAYVAEFGDGPAESRDKLRAVQAFSVDLFATSGPVGLDEFVAPVSESVPATPQQDEGRPSGSKASAPHSEPVFSVDDMTASGWETAVAQGERDLLMKMAGELLEQCDDWDDEHGVCAESVPDPACRIRAIVNRYAIQEDAARDARSAATPHLQITNEINTASPPSAGEADTTPREFRVGDEVLWRWHKMPDDGPWFKARLKEKHPANYPSGWSGEITDPGANYTSDHDGEVPPGFLVYMDVPSMTLVLPNTEREAEK